MKTILLCLAGGAAALLLFSGCLGSGAVQWAGYTPGVYEGSGRGYRGPVEVRVEVSPAGIEHIAVSHEEGEAGAAALRELLELALETGSADLDAVSGATFSSGGFLEALEAALKKAR